MNKDELIGQLFQENIWLKQQLQKQLQENEKKEEQEDDGA